MAGPASATSASPGRRAIARTSRPAAASRPKITRSPRPASRSAPRRTWRPSSARASARPPRRTSSRSAPRCGRRSPVSGPTSTSARMPRRGERGLGLCERPRRRHPRRAGSRGRCGARSSAGSPTHPRIAGRRCRRCSTRSRPARAGATWSRRWRCSRSRAAARRSRSPPRTTPFQRAAAIRASGWSACGTTPAAATCTRRSRRASCRTPTRRSRRLPASSIATPSSGRTASTRPAPTISRVRRPRCDARASIAGSGTSAPGSTRSRTRRRR